MSGEPLSGPNTKHPTREDGALFQSMRAPTIGGLNPLRRMGHMAQMNVTPCHVKA